MSCFFFFFFFQAEDGIRDKLVTGVQTCALPISVALVWQWMYHPDFGLINRVLARAGLGPVNWLGDPKTALLAVMLVSVWMQLGYELTVFLAGLRAIPQAYLDAARVDGANAWQRFWRVTFPLLRPVTLFVLVTGIIGAFQVLALVMVLTGGGPLGATDVIVYRIYRTAWELLQFGDASAMALLLFAVLFGVTWVQLKLLDRRGGEWGTAPPGSPGQGGRLCRPAGARGRPARPLSLYCRHRPPP